MHVCLGATHAGTIFQGFLILSWSHLCSLPSLPDTVNFLLTGGGTGTTWRNQVAELSRDKVLPNFEGNRLSSPANWRIAPPHFFLFFFSLLEPRRGAILKDEEEAEAEM